MRSAGNARLHGVEMRAHIGGVDMGDRHIEPRAGPADLLGRGHDGLGVTAALRAWHSRPAHATARHARVRRQRQRWRPCHSPGLPTITAHGRKQAPCQIEAQRLQRLHHRQDVGFIAAGIGIGEHRRDQCRAWPGVSGGRSEFVADLLDLECACGGFRSIPFPHLDERPVARSPMTRMSPCSNSTAPAIRPSSCRRLRLLLAIFERFGNGFRRQVSPRPS